MHIRNKGFLILEVIVSLLLIGVILVMAAPNYMNYNLRKEILKMQADTETIETTIKQYVLDGPVKSEDTRLQETYSSTNPMEVSITDLSEIFPKDDLTVIKNKISNYSGFKINWEKIKGEDKLDNLKLNNDISDYFVSVNGEYIKVYHRTGFILKDEYFNGLDQGIKIQ